MRTVELDETVGDGVVRKFADVDLAPVEHLTAKRTSRYRLVQVQHLDHVLTCSACAQVSIDRRARKNNYSLERNQESANDALPNKGYGTE